MTAIQAYDSLLSSNGDQISTSLIDAEQELLWLRRFFKDSFVGGSYLINPETANDIDVIVPEWEGNKIDVLRANGFVQMNEEYGTSEEIPELQSTWRKGALNVLVISNDYVVAYRAAARHMRANPVQYPTRTERIELHQSFKRQITQMLTLPEKPAEVF